MLGPRFLILLGGLLLPGPTAWAGPEAPASTTQNVPRSILWSNIFGLGLPHPPRYAARSIAVGYERVLSPTTSMALDVRLNQFGGTWGENLQPVGLMGVGFQPHFFPMASAPLGPYIAPFACLGIGTFYQNDAPFDAGGLETGITLGWSWLLRRQIHVRVGGGLAVIYMPDYYETIIAGGFVGDLRVGWLY